MKNSFSRCLLGLSLLWSSTALAAPKDEARRAFNEGLELIATGDYIGGIEKFEKAYDLVPHPAVLYNIARAYADAGHYEEAIQTFELYLATEPIDRAAVEGFIATLRTRMAALAPVEVPETTSTGPVATADELAELRRHAEELQALAEKLAAREQAAGEVVAVEIEEPTTVEPESLALEGALVEDLYARVVVTASRYGQDPLEAPAAITILTAEDIAMSSATSVPELLARIPGVDALSLTAGQSDLSVRGFNKRLSNKLLVLVDGRSVYLDFIGATLWEALPITLAEIDRIEVIRGPGSAIYGANAFAGVVNIITKTPGDPANDNVLRVGGGTGGYADGSAMMSGRQDNMGWRVSAGYTTYGRWAQPVDLSTRPDLYSDVEDQDTALEMTKANGQVDWRVGDRGFVSVSGGSAVGLIEFMSLGALRDFYLDQRNSYVRGDAGYGPLHVRAFYNRLNGDTGSWYHPTEGYALTSQLLSDVFDATADGNFHFGADDRHTLLVGVNYRYKSIVWGFLDADHVQHHFSGFIQDESRFGPVLLSGAVRVDKHPLIANPIPSPRLSVVTRVGEGRAVRVNAGTAFRTPTFMESYSNLYLDSGIDGVRVNTVGDPELAPERIASLEIGYLDHSTDVFRAELAVYGFQVDNLIDLTDLDSSTAPAGGFDEDIGAYVAGQASFANEGEIFRAVGAEASAEYFGIEGVDAYANYAYERIAEVGQEKTVLRATPRHKVNAGVAWRSPWTLDIGMQANWVDRQVWPIRGFDEEGRFISVDTDSPGRIVLSNKLVWHVPLGEERMDLSLNAWNWLADIQGDTVQHPLGQPIGSRYHGSVQYRF
ncbi:MAG TPA: porin family protein [Myxococcota bacterium]|nr:porin family protein [Myxococcota bacterium]